MSIFQTPFRDERIIECSLFPHCSKKIELITELSKGIFAPGDVIPINFEFVNLKNIPIKNIRIYLKKTAYNPNNLPGFQWKTEILNTCQLGRFPKLRYTHFNNSSLLIPSAAAYTSFDPPTISYEFIIKVIPLGLYRSAKVKIPIYISGMRLNGLRNLRLLSPPSYEDLERGYLPTYDEAVSPNKN